MLQTDIFTDRWTVEELSSALQVPATALRRKIAYWQTQGLLKEETTDTFVLVEEHKGRAQDSVIVEDEETESAMASAHVQREEELQVGLEARGRGGSEE